MNNTNTHSIIIQFLKIKELDEIKTINKKFYQDLIFNKQTIRDMIIREKHIKQKKFLNYVFDSHIIDILLIKYGKIDTLYNKYKNINLVYVQLYIDVLDDIFNLIASHSFDPYTSYTKSFVHIDSIFIRILNGMFIDKTKLSNILNTHLNACRHNKKLLNFIYLTSKRISYAFEPILTYDVSDNSYDLPDDWI
jgi:hypothetical protein